MIPTPTHDTTRARMSRAAHPGRSWCLRCGMPWPRVEPHVTNYTPSKGCFPLCEGCWQTLGCPEARIEYYAALIEGWALDHHPTDDDDKRAIQRAVANGGAR